jgi:hypothetical protein
MGKVKRAALQKMVCYKGSKKFCGKKVPKVPKKSKAGKEKWQKVDEKERSLLRMQKQGLLKPGQGFSQADALAKQYGLGADKKGERPTKSAETESSGVFDILSDMWTLASEAFQNAKTSVSNMISSVLGTGGEL